ncbi:MAG: hypothetical protein KF730_05225 [Sphingomonas sp.]|uniref:hypothetical protein n=1 Tax=Sphingomonas sp. TaxID=28214 RepID=UPI0025EAF784|nr:hypothetical protein [Sphingomonas sp.]MBX3563964.1 hypothetical protein [Sphingomonas sp.]
MILIGAVILPAALLSASPQAQPCGYDRAQHKITGGQATPDAQMSAKPAWFASGEVRLGGVTYTKFGAPMQMSPFETDAFQAVDEKGGVPVFMMVVDGERDDSVVYAMVSSAECSFQRFGKP